jgi:hypothetical protein
VQADDQQHTHTKRTPARKTKGGPSWMRALHPLCPARSALPSQVQQSRRPARAGGHTKPQASELFLSPLVQTLIPYRSEYTSTRPDCGGRPDDAPIPVRGRLVRCTPMEIPVCWLKWSPSEGRSLGGGEWGGGVPPLPHLHPPLHRHLLRIQARREFPPPAPSQPPGRHSKATSFASVPAAFRCRHGWPPTSPHHQAR